MPAKKSARSVSKARRKSAPSGERKSSRGEIEIIARGALFRGSSVLLCRSIKHGYAYLPGGHVEFSESASAALAREFHEECGLGVKVGPLALVSEGVFETKNRTHHEINLVFHVEPVKTLPKRVKSQESAIEFVWAEIAAIIDMDVRPLAIKAWLAAGGQERTSGPAEWVSEVQNRVP